MICMNEILLKRIEFLVFVCEYWPIFFVPTLIAVISRKILIGGLFAATVVCGILFSILRIQELSEVLREVNFYTKEEIVKSLGDPDKEKLYEMDGYKVKEYYYFIDCSIPLTGIEIKSGRFFGMVDSVVQSSGVLDPNQY